jgi:hypothetical protein
MGMGTLLVFSHDTFDCFCRPHDDDDDALAGVTDISTDVAAKTVIVQADPSVKPEDMLEKLQKARSCLLCAHYNSLSNASACAVIPAIVPRAPFWLHLGVALPFVRRRRINQNASHKLLCRQWSQSSGKSVELA